MINKVKVAWTTGEPDKRKDIPGLKNARVCSAVSRRTGKPCKAKAMSNGKCQHHGGKTNKKASSVAMRGNKNRLTTGINESITYETLTKEEREIYDYYIGNSSKETMLYNIRLRRLWHRSTKLHKKFLESNVIDNAAFNDLMKIESYLTRSSLFFHK